MDEPKWYKKWGLEAETEERVGANQEKCPGPCDFMKKLGCVGGDYPWILVTFPPIQLPPKKVGVLLPFPVYKW